MNETTAKTIENLATLALFAACAVAFELHGDSTHAVAAFAALATFAGVNRPGGPSALVSAVPQAARAVAPAAVAFGVAAIASTLGGCTPATLPAVVSVGQIVVVGTCGAAAKLCEAQDPSCGSGACHAFHTGCEALGSFVPGTPVQLACSAPPAVAAPVEGAQ